MSEIAYCYPNETQSDNLLTKAVSLYLNESDIHKIPRHNYPINNTLKNRFFERRKAEKTKFGYLLG